MASDEERTEVPVIPESQVTRPATLRALRFIRRLREMFGPDELIDIPEPNGEVVAFFSDHQPGSVAVTATEELIPEEDDDA